MLPGGERESTLMVLFVAGPPRLHTEVHALVHHQSGGQVHKAPLRRLARCTSVLSLSSRLPCLSLAGSAPLLAPFIHSHHACPSVPPHEPDNAIVSSFFFFLPSLLRSLVCSVSFSETFPYRLSSLLYLALLLLSLSLSLSQCLPRVMERSLSVRLFPSPSLP